MEKTKLIGLIEKGLSQTQIAKEIGKSLTTARYWIKKHGLKTLQTIKRNEEKNKNEKLTEKLCPSCNTIKPISDFYFHKSRNRHLKNCKTCSSEIIKKNKIEFTITERYTKIADSINWDKIQMDHIGGLSWTAISKKYHISLITLNRAEKEGRIKKINHGASNATKIAISNGRKKYLKNNPDKHWWKNKERFKSKPCEYLKQKLIESGINFIPEHQPLEDRFFSIDIAFPDKKIGIEVNGNQHYNQDKTLKPYYRKRKELIEQTGWKLFDIYFAKVYDVKFIRDLISDLKNNYDLENVDYSFYIKEKNNKYKIEKEAIIARKKEKEKITKIKIELVLNSGIDFDKWGWGRKVAKLLNIKNGGLWVKKHIPEFYKEKYLRKDRGGKSRERKYENKMDYLKARMENDLKIMNDRISLILNSVDFSKRGYCKKIMDLLNLKSRNRAGKIIKEMRNRNLIPHKNNSI